MNVLENDLIMDDNAAKKTQVRLVVFQMSNLKSQAQRIVRVDAVCSKHSQSTRSTAIVCSRPGNLALLETL